MSWMDNGGALPDLNATMFQTPGYLHVNRFRIESAPEWKIDLWIDTIAFYCELNSMTVHFEEFDHNEVALVEWTNNG